MKTVANGTLVNGIFSFSSWDDQGDFCLTFYNVQLKVQVGKYKAGTAFSSATVDFVNGTIEFDDYGDPVDDNRRPMISRGKYSIILSVGKSIDEEEPKKFMNMDAAELIDFIYDLKDAAERAEDGGDFILDLIDRVKERS